MAYFHGRSYDLTVYKDDASSLTELSSVVPDFTAGIGGFDFCNMIDWVVNQSTGIGYFLSEQAFNGSGQNPPELMRLNLGTFSAGISSTVVSDITSVGAGARLVLDTSAGNIYAFGAYTDSGTGIDHITLTKFRLSDMANIGTCSIANAFWSAGTYQQRKGRNHDSTYVYIPLTKYPGTLKSYLVRIRKSDMTDQGTIDLDAAGFKTPSDSYILSGYLYLGAQKKSDNKPVLLKIDLSTFTYSTFVYLTSLASEQVVGVCGDGTTIYTSTTGFGGTAGSLNKVDISGFSAGSPVSLTAGNPVGVFLSLSQTNELLGITAATDASKRITKFKFSTTDLSTTTSTQTTYANSFSIPAPLIDYTVSAGSSRRRVNVFVNA